MSGTADLPGPEELESQFTTGVRERLEEQKPSSKERKELRTGHTHHLVRDTTSQLKLDDDIELEGVHAEARAEVPDTFCFTCDEWIGLSGLNLRGKPRSKADAYYLGGAPDEIVRARNRVRDGLAELVGVALREVDRVESADDAAEFVADELEQTTFSLGEEAGGDP